jgi:glycosyltransferase involved in cell wall biosynthesis
MYALAEFRPDIANVPLAQNRTGFLKWLSFVVCGKLAGSKIVSRLGGQSFNNFYERSSKKMRWLIKWGLGLVEIVIVRGESLRNQFDGLISLDRVHVVPNGFDLDGWKQNFSGEEKADLEDAGTRKTKVLFLGQIIKSKGIFDFIEMVATFDNKNKLDEFEFVVAGPIVERERNLLHLDGPSSTSRALEKILNRHNIAKNIRFVGEVCWNEKRKLYRWADVMVMPSYSEGYPYTVLEAFASGCAVVCTAVGALPDYLMDGKEVLFVPTKSPEDIASRLLRLQDESLRKRLIKASQEYLRNTHSLNVFTVHMKKIFSTL